MQNYEENVQLHISEKNIGATRRELSIEKRYVHVAPKSPK